MSQKSEMIMVINSGGIPLITQTISRTKEAVEPILISGFLSAIQAFSGELRSGDKNENMSIQMGNQHVILRKYKNFSIAGLVNKNNYIIRQQIEKIAEQFRKFLPDDDEIGHLDDGIKNLFSNFILKTIASNRVSSSWIPIPIIDKSVENKINPDYLGLFEMVNGKLTVAELSRNAKIEIQGLKFTLFLWWINNIIEFKKQIDKNTICIKTDKTAKFLFSNNEYCDDYFHLINEKGLPPPCELYKNYKCKNIIGLIKDNLPVKEIVGSDQNEIYEYLHCHCERGLLSRLSRIQSQLVNIKKISNNFINTASKKLKSKEIEEIVNGMKKLLKPIASDTDINFDGTQYVLDYSIKKYIEFDQSDLIYIIEKWIEALIYLVKHLPKKKRKNIIDDLMMNYSESIMFFYNDEFDHKYELYDQLLLLLESYDQ